jgi:hypothetical protein
MHAEIGSMYQSFTAGNRGGTGVLTVEGQPVCPPCRGDTKAMARMLQLDQLIVYDAYGNVYTFVGNELLPVSQGGKGWK